MISQLINQI